MKKVQIGLRFYSDHSPISIECVLNDLKKDVWRMDNNILLNNDTVKQI